MVDRGIWNIRFNYNRGEYKVFQTNQAVIRGRNDPHEWNFRQKDLIHVPNYFYFWNALSVPGVIYCIQSEPTWPIWALPVSAGTEPILQGQYLYKVRGGCKRFLELLHNFLNLGVWETPGTIFNVLCIYCPHHSICAF